MTLNAKQRRKEALEQEYSVVSDELGRVIEPVHRLRLERQLAQIEKEILTLENELTQGKHSLINFPKPNLEFLSTLFRNKILLLSLILGILVISWILRTNVYKILLRSTQPSPLIDTIEIIMGGDSGPSNELHAQLIANLNEEQWEKLHAKTTIHLPIPEIPAESEEQIINGLYISVDESSQENISLIIELPITPAYKLDFWEEVREFHIDSNPDIASDIILGLLAYSFGQYEMTIELLSNRQLPPDAYILLAQAYLFEDQFEKSVETYELALQNSNLISVDESILNLGKALALWRPVLGVPESTVVREQYCPMSYDLYQQLGQGESFKGDAFILNEIARIHCETIELSYFRKSNTIRNGAISLNASPKLISFWEAKLLIQFNESDEKIPSLLQQAVREPDSIHLSNAILASWYARNSSFVGDNCRQSKHYYQQFRGSSYSKVNLDITSNLIDELYGYSFAEIC